MIDQIGRVEKALERICIAIPTFRRPQLLCALLTDVAGQELPMDCTIGVVVIDNDREPSSREVVVAAAAGFPFPLAYEHVPIPGLSTVRNFALRYAERFDVLVMIDDDERPAPQWLRELVRTRRTTGADVVIGPVVHEIPELAPRWLRRSRQYDLPKFEDGAAIEFGYSGNCLLDVAALRRFGISFDTGLNFSGGEDMLFFRQLLGCGARMRFAARAIASEPLGAERLTASYLIKLNYRRGNTLAMCDRRLGGGVSRLALRALKGAARVVVGVVGLAPLCVVRGRRGVVESLSNIAHGLGSFAGLSGHVYEAYRRPD